MNIQFNSIRYKNILSTGNVFTDIPLNKNRTTLVSGTNGSGKSTILDAITFALYGKPFRKINKPQLINTINTKDLVVEVNFTVSGNDYLIRRGMKPNIFEIYRNGELVNQDAAVRDYQAYLEQNILGLNYKSFNQIVVLGSATYVPFMELPAYQRREIIEDLLDIQVFSTMNLLLKDRVSLNKESITDNNYQIDLIKSKIESAVEHNESIRKIREGEVNKIRERMQDHIDRIEEEKTFIEEIEVTIKALIDSIEDKPVIKKKLEKTKNIRQELDTVLRGYLKDLNFYHDNDNCPTCKQGIDHNFKETIVYERNQKKREAEDGMDGIEIKITELEARIEEISKVEDVIQSHNLKIGEHRAQIKMSMNAIKSRFRDAFSYASFSEGEKLRISLSIMLSWRAVAKLRNSVSTNLLILDETLDGAMDGAGVENLIDTLHNLNNNDNIFVISHRGDQFGEKFDSNIRFEKVKNFSQIAA